MNQIRKSILRTLETEISGLNELQTLLKGALSEPFSRAVQCCQASTGRIIITGMGKSGHIGTKIAATFASTGTPSFFVHPAEANHGDLGMICKDDVVIALSWSGEAAELQGILAYAGRFKIPVIAITANPKSTLARESEICLCLPKVKEACPHGLAPTTSAALQLVTGDCLAVALLESRGFSSDDFKTFHPGGQLGANLTYVGELMHEGDAIPLTPYGTPINQAVNIISDKGLGCVGVTDEQGLIIGVITDGDLRRNIDRNLFQLNVEAIMTTNPKIIEATAMASKAVAEMHDLGLTALFVTEQNKPVGIIHMHDLLRAGVA